MPSSSVRALIGAVIVLCAGGARAQGFAVERFYPAPAGGGWFALDGLEMRGGLGGALSMTLGYASQPLPGVVSDQAFAQVGAAVTWNRWRLSFDFDSPLLIQGPGLESVTLGSNPDTVADPRLGVDVRFFGRAGEAVRLGASAQLFVPNGNPADFDSDGTARGMFRLLFAGDRGRYRYAAHLGVHLRSLGDELLFGAAWGATFPAWGRWDLVAGPELFGETGLRSLSGATTGLEGLLTARLETRGAGPQVRVRLGLGGGLDPRFGTPAWRLLVGVEYFNRGSAAE